VFLLFGVVSAHTRENRYAASTARSQTCLGLHLILPEGQQRGEPNSLFPVYNNSASFDPDSATDASVPVYRPIMPWRSLERVLLVAIESLVAILFVGLMIWGEYWQANNRVEKRDEKADIQSLLMGISSPAAQSEG
jgi:hypothetical protein